LAQMIRQQCRDPKQTLSSLHLQRSDTIQRAYIHLSCRTTAGGGGQYHVRSLQ
jgi:hypothetical protein